jgi:hypothetical protein
MSINTLHKGDDDDNNNNNNTNNNNNNSNNNISLQFTISAQNYTLISAILQSFSKFIIFLHKT